MFWLAIVPDLHDFIVNSMNEVDVSVKEAIWRSANFQYSQMFEANDIYLTGFIFDPRDYFTYPDSLESFDTTTSRYQDIEDLVFPMI